MADTYTKAEIRQMIEEAKAQVDERLKSVIVMSYPTEPNLTDDTQLWLAIDRAEMKN